MDNTATIQRGEVIEVSDDGYKVRSLDLKGIETPPILAINGSYSEGDKVCFLSFRMVQERFYVKCKGVR